MAQPPKLAGRPAGFELTERMLQAGVRVIRESELVEHPGLINSDLVRETVEAVFSARQGERSR
jgi:hypothetical protein